MAGTKGFEIYKHELTDETEGGLIVLDKYLSNYKLKDKLDDEVIHKVRDLISDIIDRGYYTTKEQLILNAMRSTYYDDKLSDNVKKQLSK